MKKRLLVLTQTFCGPDRGGAAIQLSDHLGLGWWLLYSGHSGRGGVSCLCRRRRETKSCEVYNYPRISCHAPRVFFAGEYTRFLRSARRVFYQRVIFGEVMIENVPGIFSKKSAGVVAKNVGIRDCSDLLVIYY